MLYAPCSALFAGMAKGKAGGHESRFAMGTYNISMSLTPSLGLRKETEAANCFDLCYHV